jgi:hypothetical protein
VGERPCRAREVGVAPERLVQGQSGAILDPRWELGPRQRPLRHQPVEVRLRPRELPIGARQGAQRIGRIRCGAFEGIGELGESVGDDRRLDRGLVGEVLVQRGRADAQAIGEAPHRQALDALLLEELAGGGDDLCGAGSERLT